MVLSRAGGRGRAGTRQLGKGPGEREACWLCGVVQMVCVSGVVVALVCCLWRAGMMRRLAAAKRRHAAKQGAAARLPVAHSFHACRRPPFIVCVAVWFVCCGVREKEGVGKLWKSCLAASNDMLRKPHHTGTHTRPKRESAVTFACVQK